MNERRLDPSTHLSPVSATSCSSQLASSNSCKCSFTSISSSSSSLSSSHRAPTRVKCTTRNMYQATSAISIVIVLTLGVLYTFSSPVNAFQGNIRFQNNGYSGITVSFQPEIEYSLQGTLIVELQVSVQTHSSSSSFFSLSLPLSLLLLVRLLPLLCLVTHTHALTRSCDVRWFACWADYTCSLFSCTLKLHHTAGGWPRK